MNSSSCAAHSCYRIGSLRPYDRHDLTETRGRLDTLGQHWNPWVNLQLPWQFEESLPIRRLAQRLQYERTSRILAAEAKTLLADGRRDFRVFIVEGIPGAGKSTFCRALEKLLADKPVYGFDENALLLGWIHDSLDGIQRLRTQLVLSVLDFIEQTLRSDPDAVFILDRFHLSFALDYSPELHPSIYPAILDRLSKLPAITVVLYLDEQLIARRLQHAERTTKAWNALLQRIEAHSPYSSLSEHYARRQERLVRLAHEQCQFEGVFSNVIELEGSQFGGIRKTQFQGY